MVVDDVDVGLRRRRRDRHRCRRPWWLSVRVKAVRDVSEKLKARANPEQELAGWLSEAEPVLIAWKKKDTFDNFAMNEDNWNVCISIQAHSTGHNSIYWYCKNAEILKNCHSLKMTLPPLAPNEAMMRVTKVRKSGVEAEKNEIRMDSSSLLVRSTRKTSSGITKKL